MVSADRQNYYDGFIKMQWRDTMGVYYEKIIRIYRNEYSNLKTMRSLLELYYPINSTSTCYYQKKIPDYA